MIYYLANCNMHYLVNCKYYLVTREPLRVESSRPLAGAGLGAFGAGWPHSSGGMDVTVPAPLSRLI